MDGDVHIGTSGWSYTDWEGPFYPDGTPARDYLGFYAETVDLMEVDSTYYRTPGGKMVQGRAVRTAEHFRFALKAPGEITHKKMVHGADGDMDEFLAATRTG